MASRRRFGGFRPRFSGARSSRQVPRWTAQSDEQLLTAGSPNRASTLYLPGSTIGATQYEEEALLVRVVGRLSVTALDNGTVLGGPVGLGIIKTQASTAPTVGGANDPLIATELTARDWLRVMNVQVPPESGPNGWAWYHEMDIRVKRRMKAEDRIVLMMMNGTGDDVVITIDVRILVVIRM